MLELDSYTTVNQSFKSSLVFRLGVDAGFFSEFNNMILAMAWCLENERQFKLYSRNSWFSDIGWTSFFKPFTKEVRWPIHDKINNRYGAPENKTHRYLHRWIYRFLHPNTLLTYEGWRFFRDSSWLEHEYIFPNLNFQGNLQSLCKKLTEMVWVYNDQTEQTVKVLKDSILLKQPYVGFHIRGGDKFKEDRLHPFREYLEEMEKFSEIRTAFVLTDDYDAFKKAQDDFPEWDLHTLCEEDEAGYFHQEFMKMPKHYIRRKTLRLFASVDILKDAEYFLGTFSSNPGMFLGMRMDPDRCLSVDGGKWTIW